MPPTRCLYIDDQERDRATGITPTLRQAFTEAFRFARLDVDAHDFDEGERVLHAHGGDYDLIVIDVYEERDGKIEIRGFQLIREASSTTDAAVIGISQFSDTGAEAISAGAHAFVHKDALRRAHGPSHLSDQMRQAVKSAGVSVKPETEITLDYDQDDVRLAAVIDRIGEDHLLALLAQIAAPTPERVKLNYVRGGLSGAIVLHWEYSGSYGKQELLLKVSRDWGRMLSEERAWQEARFGQVLVPAPTHGLVEAGGWYALAPKFRRGVTLTDWLCHSDKASTAEAIAAALDELFGDGGLSEVAASSSVERPNDRPSDVVAAGLLTLHRSANIALAMSELKPLLARHVPDEITRLELARRLLRSGMIADIDAAAVPRGSYLVRCHGDLHGRNVLVDSRNHVVLLDPADSAMLHWSADWARLTVDLLLSGIASDPRAHEWALIGSWRAAADALVRGAAVPETEALPVPARTAVNWLRTEAPPLFTGVGDGVPSEWELRLGLTAELLRGSYRREELPAPLRVVALVAALDGIEAAAEELPARDD